VGLWWTWHVLVGLSVILATVVLPLPDVSPPNRNPRFVDKWEKEKPTPEYQQTPEYLQAVDRFDRELNLYNRALSYKVPLSSWLAVMTALLLLGYLIVHKRWWTWYFLAELCVFSEFFVLSGLIYTPFSQRLVGVVVLAALLPLGYVLFWYFHFRMKSFSDRVHSAFSIGDYDLAIHLLDGAGPFWTTEMNKVYLLCGIAKDKRGIDGGPNFDKAVALNRNYAEAHYHRANHYYAQGKYAEALTDYIDTLRLDPKHARAYYNRASAYLDFGNQEQAHLSWGEARRLDPKVEQAADIIQPRQSQGR